MTSSTKDSTKLPCHICGKMGLYNQNCRCDKIVCMKHRLFMEHNCNYDYRKAERERLKKENPIISPQKVVVI